MAPAEADLLVTMSSTACLEATDRGSRVALVLDLGSTSGTATRSSSATACRPWCGVR
ncbi:hypothetical protein AB8B12_23715 [Streptomyces sp. PGLac3x]